MRNILIWCELWLNQQNVYTIFAGYKTEFLSIRHRWISKSDREKFNQFCLVAFTSHLLSNSSQLKSNGLREEKNSVQWRKCYVKNWIESESNVCCKCVWYVRNFIFIWRTNSPVKRKRKTQKKIFLQPINNRKTKSFREREREIERKTAN